MEERRIQREQPGSGRGILRLSLLLLATGLITWLSAGWFVPALVGRMALAGVRLLQGSSELVLALVVVGVGGAYLWLLVMRRLWRGPAAGLVAGQPGR